MMRPNGETRLRILVADDHPSVRENLRYLLNFEPDLEVVGVARDGREALRLILELSPNVAILDHEMPGLDGIDVALRSRQERPSTHVILYTSATALHEEADLVGAGVIAKDAPVQELLAAIRDGGRRERTDLAHAIAEGLLDVAVQPIVDLRGVTLRRFELLCRWRHQRRGLIDPRRFIALAEGGGLISQLTHLVLRRSALAALTWRSDEPIALNLNVSPISLVEPAFVADMERVLAELQFPADRLRIEITETTLAREPVAIAAALDRLREAGIRVAVDDFGTGFSSLSRLVELPVDAVKIDRQFVGVMTRSHKAHAIVRASIQLAHDLGIEAVAEGVEDQETWDLLRALGCDAGQGYLIAAPLGIADVPDLLERWPVRAAELARTGRRDEPRATEDREVLVVDDEPVLTDMIRDILEQEGFRVTTAANGMEALREIKRQRPAVVLLDVSMPIVDGPTLAKTLRERAIKVPIVVMTAGSSAVRWAHELGADGYLSKPFELSALLDIANRFAKPERPSLDA